MTTVHLSGVSKTYTGAEPALAETSLTVASGEFFTLLGPSGCGKTTTLRIVAGFETPSTGTVRFGDRDVTALPPERRDLGMVFQNYALFPHLDVAGNVGYGLRNRAVARDERERRVTAALASVGLDALAARAVSDLSGGQQQRVALARALVVSPQVLLLDEPLSNLDARLRDETRTQVRALQREAGITTLYVTHDQAEALAVSDRIAVLEHGVVHQVGTPWEIYHRPSTAFVATFIGRANLIAGTVRSRRSGGVEVEVAPGAIIAAHAPETATGTASALLAIRPERITVTPEGGGTLAATVTGVEFLGSHSLLTLLARTTAGEIEVRATVPEDGHARIGIAPGDRVGLDLSKAQAWEVSE